MAIEFYQELNITFCSWLESDQPHLKQHAKCVDENEEQDFMGNRSDIEKINNELKKSVPSSIPDADLLEIL